MMIRNYGTGGLKAQKLIAQGIALGLVSEFVRPERAKALIFRALLELLPLQGEYTNALYIGRCPMLCANLALSGRMLA